MFYVYRITNIELNKHYYGSRKPKNNRTPEDDLGTHYFSSSRDKQFIQDQKSRTHAYKYKVIARNLSREESLKLEIKLHNKFQVDINPHFYNRSKQTSTKWTCTKATGKLISESHKNGGAKKISDSHKKLFEIGIRSHEGENNPRYGDHRNWDELYGSERANELRNQKSITNSGANNPIAKKWMFTDPDGNEYIIEGQCKQFCKDHNLLMVTLKRTLGEVVTMPKHLKPKSKTWTSRMNTVGWRLNIV